MKTTAFALIAASLVSALAVAPAQAAAPRAQVNYADLDITSATGAAALATRIQGGVDHACARSADLRDIKAMVTCKEALLSDAVAQLNTKGATLAAAQLSAKV